MATPDWLKPKKGDIYIGNGDTQSFREWLRASREPEPHDAELSDFATRGNAAVNEAAKAELEAYLNGKKPRKKER
jgi:hypothetical protein